MAGKLQETGAGIPALFAFRASYYRTPEDYTANYTRHKLSPTVTLLESQYPGGGDYYVTARGRLRAYFSWDHEFGDTREWTIDSTGEGPLFVANWRQSETGEESLHLGFKSRGIQRPDSEAPYLPETTAQYKKVGEQFVFEGINGPQNSVTTGEKVKAEWKKLRNGRIVITSRLESGVIEGMQLPQTVPNDFVEAVSADMKTINDPTMSYLTWQQQLGCAFLVSTLHSQGK